MGQERHVARAAPGERDGEPGSWRVFKPTGEPWEIWFRNKYPGPKGGHRRGRFHAGGFKTAAEAKAAVEAAAEKVAS